MTPGQREIAEFGEMTEIIPAHDPSHGESAEFGEKTELIKVMTPATAKSPISPQRVCFALFYGFYLGVYRHYKGDPCKTYF